MPLTLGPGSGLAGPERPRMAGLANRCRGQRRNPGGPLSRESLGLVPMGWRQTVSDRSWRRTSAVGLSRTMMNPARHLGLVRQVAGASLIPAAACILRPRGPGHHRDGQGRGRAQRPVVRLTGSTSNAFGAPARASHRRERADLAHRTRDPGCCRRRPPPSRHGWGRGLAPPPSTVRLGVAHRRRRAPGELLRATGSSRASPRRGTRPSSGPSRGTSRTASAAAPR